MLDHVAKEQRHKSDGKHGEASGGAGVGSLSSAGTSADGGSPLVFTGCRGRRPACGGQGFDVVEVVRGCLPSCGGLNLPTHQVLFQTFTPSRHSTLQVSTRDGPFPRKAEADRARLRSLLVDGTQYVANAVAGIGEVRGPLHDASRRSLLIFPSLPLILSCLP